MDNYCLTCGKEITPRRTYCEDCVKKIDKRRNLSNIDVLTKYHNSRSKLKKVAEDFVGKIEWELNSLSLLKHKFILNSDAQKVLDEKMALLVTLKNKLINDWRETLLE
jgi:predicted amidophosphoribosyltransferase